MSTATVQQISQDLTTWLGLARDGETVAIMDQGQVIAQLGPPVDMVDEEGASPTKSMAEWMELQDRRMKRTFGSRIVADSSALLDEMRADRE